MKFESERQRKAVMSRYNKDNKFSYAPVYAAGDIPLMGVDVIGTAGATAVGAVPLVAGLGAIYVGSDIALKTKERLQKQYHDEMKKPKTYSQRLLEKEKTKKKRNRFSYRGEELDYYDWGTNALYQ